MVSGLSFPHQLGISETFKDVLLGAAGKPKAGGRFVFVWDGGNGGVFDKNVFTTADAGEPKRVSLLLATSQVNSLQFASTSQAATRRLIQALREGGDPAAFRRVQEQMAEVAKKSGFIPSQEESVGLPAWVGTPHPGAQPRSANPGLRELQRIDPGAVVGRGVRPVRDDRPGRQAEEQVRLDENEYAAASVAQRADCLRAARGKDPFAHLELAALDEILRQPKEAAESYDTFIKAAPSRPTCRRSSAGRGRPPRSSSATSSRMPGAGWRRRTGSGPARSARPSTSSRPRPRTTSPRWSAT